jgi:hypothetical protein
MKRQVTSTCHKAQMQHQLTQYTLYVAKNRPKQVLPLLLHRAACGWIFPTRFDKAPHAGV